MTTTDFQVVKNGMHDIAAQAYALAMGLQNASPPQGENKPIKSVQYLLETATQLEQVIRSIDELVSKSDHHE